jgi:hypothetical protein
LSEAAVILGAVLDSTFAKMDSSYIHFCTSDGCNAMYNLGLHAGPFAAIAELNGLVTSGACNTLLGHGSVTGLTCSGTATDNVCECSTGTTYSNAAGICGKF